MSAIRSLSGEDRTWRRQPNSVENDPFRTCAPSPNRLSELLSRATQDMTQVRERAPWVAKIVGHRVG
jgi:hypothetical protein